MWNATKSSVPHDASTSWSENVTLQGFRACVLVSGRYAYLDFHSPPSVYWVVFNLKKDYFNSSANVQNGILALNSFYTTASQCKNITSISNSDLSDYRVLTSVHRDNHNFPNAMAVWTEHAPSTALSNLTNIRICVRKLRNSTNGRYEEGFIVSISKPFL